MCLRCDVVVVVAADDVSRLCCGGRSACVPTADACSVRVAVVAAAVVQFFNLIDDLGGGCRRRSRVELVKGRRFALLRAQNRFAQSGKLRRDLLWDGKRRERRAGGGGGGGRHALG